MDKCVGIDKGRIIISYVTSMVLGIIGIAVMAFN